jgi:beta-lactamase regulating signal transducer with metallopeptidase domain
MTAETILSALVRSNVVASVAIVLVLALRPWVLRWLGASVAYWFWLVVLIAAGASFVPAREEIVLIQPTASLTGSEEADYPVETSPMPPHGASTQVSPTPVVSLPALADLLVAVWLVGAAALFARSVLSARSFSRTSTHIASPATPSSTHSSKSRAALAGSIHSRISQRSGSGRTRNSPATLPSSPPVHPRVVLMGKLSSRLKLRPPS